jgi:hypothetical protein
LVVLIRALALFFAVGLPRFAVAIGFSPSPISPESTISLITSHAHWRQRKRPRCDVFERRRPNNHDLITNDSANSALLP